MRGKYEDIETLVHHIPILVNRLDNLRDQITGEAFIQMGTNQDWMRVSKFVEEKLERIRKGEDKDVPLPRDIKTVIDTITPHFKDIYPNIDYICSWLSCAVETIKIFDTTNNLLNLRSELPLTIKVCEIFTAFTKSIASMHYLSSHVNFAWFCCTLGGSAINLSAPREFVDDLLAKISSKPFDYVAEKIKPLRLHLENLTTQLSTIFSQLFAVYSLFEWIILSIEGADTLDSESTLIHSNYIVLQNLYLFYMTIIFFGLVFPQFFANNANFGSFAISIYSESRSIRLTNSFVAPIATLLNLASESLPLKIMNSSLKDIESKMTTSHPKRIRCLTNLFMEYYDRVTVNDDVLGLYFEQILAIYGFSFYELMICHESNPDMPILADMLSASLDLRTLIENSEQFIQRTYLYTLRAIDVGYLRDLTMKTKGVSVSLNPNYLSCFNSIALTVNYIDLEQFDNGVRYDLYPLLLTHGRLIAFPYTSGEDDDVSMIYSLLEHLMAMMRHFRFVESPLEFLSEIYPLDKNSYIVKKLPKYIKSEDSNLHSILSVLKIFTVIPFFKELTESFSGCCEAICHRVVRALEDTMSLGSKNVQAVQQVNLDPTYDLNRYLPPQRKSQREVYIRDASEIFKCSSAIEIVNTMPDIIHYGSLKYDMKDKMTKVFLHWINKYILEGTYSPFFAASIFNMLDQVIGPFFTALGVPFVPTILQKTRNASPLTGDETFSSQYLLYTCQEKPKPATGYINNYILQMTQFIEIGHKTAQYEQLGRRFVTIGSSQFQAEQFFSMEAMKYLITMFGIRSGVRINGILMSHYFVLYNQIMMNFVQLSPQINNWYLSYMTTKKIDYKAITCDHMKECSELLLSIGLVKVMRIMLGKATSQVLDEVVPSLNTIVDTAKAKTNDSKLKNEIAAFLESINPGGTDDFLVERARLANKNQVDTPKFFFFLGLLFANHDWDDAKFNSENDQFAHNLQLLPRAIDGLVAVIKGMAEESVLVKSVALFFQVLATIAAMKREKNRLEYANFIILIHHILDSAESIHYGNMKNAFFFAEIRSCYNEVVDEDLAKNANTLERKNE